MKKQMTDRYMKAAIVLTFLFGLSLPGLAQQVPVLSQYYNKKFLAYPSSSAFAERPGLSLVYRGQFSGIEGAPRSFGLSFENTLGKSSGYGANLISNEIGFIRQYKVGAGLGQLLMEGPHELSVGALAGLSFFSINEDILSPETFNDPVLSQLVGNNGMALNIDLSLSYRFRGFGLDAAVPGLVNESLSDDEYVQVNEDNVPDYIAGVFYRFPLDPVKGVYLTPNVTWRYRTVIGSELDFLAKLDFGDMFRATVGYRDNYGATVGVGIHISPNMLFSYNYDFGRADVPFLSNGFNEFSLHFSFRNKEERMRRRYAEGEAVLSRIRGGGIYERGLIPGPEQRLVVDYLSSLQSTGSKKEKREIAEGRFDEILEGMRQAEQARLEARVAMENEKQDSVRRVEAAAEAERLRVEAEKQGPEAQPAVDPKPTDAQPRAKEDRPQPGISAPLSIPQKATGAAISNLSPAEQARVREVNRLVEPERLMEIAWGGNPNSLTSIDVEFVVVIASYPVDSRYSRLFLNGIKGEFPEVKIFASRKRQLDYVYIGGYNSYEAALQRMKAIRSGTRFTDAWVHIVRLSEIEK